MDLPFFLLRLVLASHVTLSSLWLLFLPYFSVFPSRPPVSLSFPSRWFHCCPRWWLTEKTETLRDRGAHPTLESREISGPLTCNRRHTDPGGGTGFWLPGPPLCPGGGLQATWCPGTSLRSWPERRGLSVGRRSQEVHWDRPSAG